MGYKVRFDDDNFQLKVIDDTKFVLTSAYTYHDVPSSCNLEVDILVLDNSIVRIADAEERQLYFQKTDLEETKQDKKRLLLNNYISAQYVKIENGVSFEIPLRGKHFSTFKEQLLIATVLPSLKLIIYSIPENQVDYEIDITNINISDVAIQMIERSQFNWWLKTRLNHKIEKAITIDELNNINITFPEQLVINMQDSEIKTFFEGTLVT